MKQKGLSGSTLKIIALLTMIIDHIGAVVVATYMMHHRIYWNMNEMPGHPMVWLYIALRLIGRLGFPLYIFLLVEGFTHTRNEWKYLGRMVLFCFLSEIPFDMAVNLKRSQVLKGIYWEYGSQNVFFTLAIGLFTLILIRKVEQRFSPMWQRMAGYLLFAGLGMVAAHYLHTDYGEFGVAAIVVMYLLRNKPIKATVATCSVLMLSSPFEFTAYLVCVPISMYNKTRGLSLKYIFYALYPIHLLILAWIAMWCV